MASGFKDYKQGQQIALFPVDLNSIISPKHLVRQIDKVVDGINSGKLLKVFPGKGASAYHPQMMLKIIIYAYATKNYSSRNIAALCRQDVTYMWLTGMQTPDFNTINRFRSVYLKEVVEEVFTDVLLFLHQHDYIKFENYFVDGTKLEADARKHSIVWKKNTERYKGQVQERVEKLLDEIEQLNKQEDTLFKGMDLPQFGDKSQITSQDIDAVAKELDQKLQSLDNNTTKKAKAKVKSQITKLKHEKENLEKYEKQDETLGTRNSYSTTDPDSSAMRMKGTDELRPGVNAQISTENQFVTNYSASQNASDNSDFVPHLEKIVQRGSQFIPDNYTGDAAYGSEENYEALEKHGIGNYLKFNTFHIEQTKEYKNNIFKKENFAYDAQTDCYQCPNGQKLKFLDIITKKTLNAYTQEIRRYQAENCEGCPLKEKCTTSSGNRTIQINPNLERHKEKARQNLNSPQGQALRKRRGWEVETFFGDLKHNQKYRRIRLRGKEKAEIELGWLSISYNIRKLSKLENNPMRKARA